MMYKTVHGLVDINTHGLLDEQVTQTRDGSLPSTYRRMGARKAVYSESFFPRTYQNGTHCLESSEMQRPLTNLNLDSYT